MGRRYTFEWVKGHIGHVMNEAADARARAVAEAYARGAAIPSGPGFPGAAPARVESVRTTPAPAAAPSLFDFDEPEPAAPPAALTTVQQRRILNRAKADGMTVDQLLDRLL